MTDTVWTDRRYDSGARYDAAVTRKGDTAYLTVTLHGNVDHLLHREAVNCDSRADIDRWRSRCEAVIANPDLRSIDP